MLRILHLTDLHITAGETEQPGRSALGSLHRIADMVPGLVPGPDAILISGDLTDHGDVASYEILREALTRFEAPVLCAMGNHDLRAAFRSVIGDAEGAGDAPLAYDRVLGDWHIVVLDTSVPGRTSGALDDGQFAFLDAALARHPDHPKIMMFHHPPKRAPLGRDDWASLGHDDTARLADAISAADVRLILTGHVHVDRVVHWQGVPVVTSTGLQARHDPTKEIAQTGGVAVVEGAGFALCDVTAEDIAITFVPAGQARTVRTVPAGDMQALR